MSSHCNSKIASRIFNGSDLYYQLRRVWAGTGLLQSNGPAALSHTIRLAQNPMLSTRGMAASACTTVQICH